jgi:L-threonylcarbamoyladenylate synthase
VVHPWKLREAARHFRSGGLLAYPTEAVYGLGCDPLNADAVLGILRLKQRPIDKGLILVAADYAQLRPFITPLDDEAMQRVFASWPGPTTWLLPAAPDLPYWLSGKHATLAVRVSDHPLTAALCRACNSPLVSTSANPAGLPPARNALTVRRMFDDRLDYLLVGDTGRRLTPSRIIDAASGRIIRA